jgi:hypothetical protein
MGVDIRQLTIFPRKSIFRVPPIAGCSASSSIPRIPIPITSLRITSLEIVSVTSFDVSVGIFIESITFFAADSSVSSDCWLTILTHFRRSSGCNRNAGIFVLVGVCLSGQLFFEKVKERNVLRRFRLTGRMRVVFPVVSASTAAASTSSSSSAFVATAATTTSTEVGLRSI